jgi:hypothetical protein
VRLATDKLIWRGRCPVPLGPQLMIGHE